MPTTGSTRSRAYASLQEEAASSRSVRPHVEHGEQYHDEIYQENLESSTSCREQQQKCTGLCTRWSQAGSEEKADAAALVSVGLTLLKRERDVIPETLELTAGPHISEVDKVNASAQNGTRCEPFLKKAGLALGLASIRCSILLGVVLGILLGELLGILHDKWTFPQSQSMGMLGAPPMPSSAPPSPLFRQPPLEHPLPSMLLPASPLVLLYPSSPLSNSSGSTSNRTGQSSPLPTTHSISLPPSTPNLQPDLSSPAPQPQPAFSLPPSTPKPQPPGSSSSVCPGHYAFTPRNLDGDGKKWHEECMLGGHLPCFLRCADICDAAAACTSFEFKASGEEALFACGTYTGGSANILPQNQVSKDWISCIKSLPPPLPSTPHPPPSPPQSSRPVRYNASVQDLNDRYVACEPGVLIRGFDAMSRSSRLPWTSYWPHSTIRADRMSGSMTNARIPFIFMRAPWGKPEFNDSPPGHVTIGDRSASIGAGGVIFSAAVAQLALLCSYERDVASVNDRRHRGCGRGHSYSPSELMKMLASHEKRASGCQRSHNINNCYNEVRAPDGRVLSHFPSQSAITHSCTA